MYDIVQAEIGPGKSTADSLTVEDRKGFADFDQPDIWRKVL